MGFFTWGASNDGGSYDPIEKRYYGSQRERQQATRSRMDARGATVSRRSGDDRVGRRYIHRDRSDED